MLNNKFLKKRWLPILKKLKITEVAHNGKDILKFAKSCKKSNQTIRRQKELLGEYFYALKKYDDAIITLESCVNEKDFSTRATFLLSEIYLKQNNGDKAKLYAEKYLTRKRQSSKYFSD